MSTRRWVWVIWVALGLAAMALLLYRAVWMRQGYDEVAIWVGAFCTLSIFSFLYKENAV